MENKQEPKTKQYSKRFSHHCIQSAHGKRNNRNDGSCETKLANFPSYRGSVKWIKDNMEKIDTFVDLLNIYPDLIRHKMLTKFVSYLKSYKLSTAKIGNSVMHDEADVQNKEGPGTIPAITITNEAFTTTPKKKDKYMKLLVTDKKAFEEENGECTKLFSELSKYFYIHCHDKPDSDTISFLSHCDACLVLLTNNSFENQSFVSFIQHVKMMNMPVHFLRSPTCEVPTNVRDARSQSSCSLQSIDRLSPISIPLPPISRTPNFLKVDSSVLHTDNTFVLALEAFRGAIVYDFSNLYNIIVYVCKYFKAIEDSDEVENTFKTHRIEVSKDLYSMPKKSAETPARRKAYSNKRSDTKCKLESPQILIDGRNTKFKDKPNRTKTEFEEQTSPDTISEQDGARLIVNEHMTNCKPQKTVHNDKKNFQENKNKLEVPKISKNKTTPDTLSHGQKDQKANKDARKKDIKFQIMDEADSDENIFMLFPSDKGNFPVCIVDWPNDLKNQNTPPDETLSEGSCSTTGFQDIDFSASLWSGNSDED